MSDNYILYGSDILSKFGFGDGDMFEDQIWDYEEQHSVTIDCAVVLWKVVRKYLVPLPPEGIELEFIGTNHNPVRKVFDGPIDLSVEINLENIEVTVTREQVEEIIREYVR